MKRFCTAAAALLLAACSGQDETSPATAQTNQPQCNCALPPRLPHLTDTQKKSVFAALSAQSVNEDVVNTFLFGGTASDPQHTDLLKMLADSHCLRETKQDQDGRSNGRIYGDACPIAAQTSFLNASTPTGSKEDRSVEISVSADDYAAKSQIQKYGLTESADGKVTETSPKHFHVDMTGSSSGSLEAKGAPLSFQGTLSGTSDVDNANEDFKILTLDMRADTMLHFENFDALLSLTSKTVSSGHIAVELLLNGEKVPVPPALAASWTTRLERATARRALSGI